MVKQQKKQLSSTQRAALLEDLKDTTIELETLAAKYDVTTSYIGGLARRANRDPSMYMTPATLSDQTYSEVEDMLHAGERVRAVARKTGVNQQVVREIRGTLGPLVKVFFEVEAEAEPHVRLVTGF